MTSGGGKYSAIWGSSLAEGRECASCGGAARGGTNPGFRLAPAFVPAELAPEICIAEIEGDYERLIWLSAAAVALRMGRAA